MSAESELRNLLKPLFDPFDWYDNNGDARDMDPRQILDDVLARIRECELLITGGTILHVQRAWPQSGVFDDAQWEVALGCH